MIRQVIGVVTIFVVLILAAVLLPVANGLLDLNRDSGTGGYNCETYAGANPYNSSLDTNTFGCAVVPLIVPLLLLIIILGSIGTILYGGSPQPGYQ